MIRILHLKTQRDQPYGSNRRCCERCGKISEDLFDAWTDNEDAYMNPPYSYITCEEHNRHERKLKTINK